MDRESSNEIRLAVAIESALAAGKILLQYWGLSEDELKLKFKVDQFDPVTKADQESDSFIRAQITQSFPQDLILSEENDFTPDLYDERVWMIDPMDDTKAFLAGKDSFSISIACVNNGIPEIGVVYAPAREVLYYAIKGKGAFMEKDGNKKQIFGNERSSLATSRIIIKLPSPRDSERPLDIIVKTALAQAFIEDGSIALAIARIAAGEAECTICTNPRVSKWDSAGGQAILNEVGGIVTDIKGKALNYKQAERGWASLVVASVNSTIHEQFISHLEN